MRIQAVATAAAAVRHLRKERKCCQTSKQLQHEPQHESMPLYAVFLHVASPTQPTNQPTHPWPNNQPLLLHRVLNIRQLHQRPALMYIAAQDGATQAHRPVMRLGIQRATACGARVEV